MCHTYRRLRQESVAAPKTKLWRIVKQNREQKKKSVNATPTRWFEEAAVNGKRPKFVAYLQALKPKLKHKLYFTSDSWPTLSMSLKIVVFETFLCKVAA